MINSENFDKFWKFVKLVAELAFVPENTIFGRITKYQCQYGVASEIGALIDIPAQEVTEILGESDGDCTDNDDFPWTVQNEQQVADEAQMANCENMNVNHEGTVTDNIMDCEDIEGLNTNHLLENVSNNTHTITHLMMNLINIVQAAALDAHDSNAYNTKLCRNDDDKHSDGKHSRIIVTFESSDMTQEIGSADVSNDGIHATGVNLGINRIDKRINITDALKGIINSINNTPEVRR